MRKTLTQSLRQYELAMFARSSLKVKRSRDAAVFLHSSHAMVERNVTRAKAAEDYFYSLSQQQQQQQQRKHHHDYNDDDVDDT